MKKKAGTVSASSVGMIISTVAKVIAPAYIAMHSGRRKRKKGWYLRIRNKTK